jgi:hypothetical protein
MGYEAGIWYTTEYGTVEVPWIKSVSNRNSKWPIIVIFSYYGSFSSSKQSLQNENLKIHCRTLNYFFYSSLSLSLVVPSSANSWMGNYLSSHQHSKAIKAQPLHQSATTNPNYHYTSNSAKTKTLKKNTTLIVLPNGTNRESPSKTPPLTSIKIQRKPKNLHDRPTTLQLQQTRNRGQSDSTNIKLKTQPRNLPIRPFPPQPNTHKTNLPSQPNQTFNHN